MVSIAPFVVIEWLDIMPTKYPRYSFATVVHARELGDAVRWVEPCKDVDTAAALAAQLNAPRLASHA